MRNPRRTSSHLPVREFLRQTHRHTGWHAVHQTNKRTNYKQTTNKQQTNKQTNKQQTNKQNNNKQTTTLLRVSISTRISSQLMGSGEHAKRSRRSVYTDKLFTHISVA